jgi:hypothetical protein
MPAQTRNSAVFFTSDFDPKSVYGRLQSVIGLRGNQRWWLALAIFLPLLIFAGVTLWEGCFFLQSVLSEGMLMGEKRQLLGMSFLGDPMGWGFMIAVPILVLVLKLATDRTLSLVNTVAEKASEAWKKDDSPNGLHAVCQNTKKMWKMQRSKPGWLKHVLLYGPWIVAIVFWGFNTVTCAFHPYLDPACYPYRSDRVKLLTQSPSESKAPASAENPSPPPSTEESLLTYQFQGRPIEAKIVQTKTDVELKNLNEPISLRKWDCEPGRAPLSCWLTRLWTLPYYGVIPFLLRHLVLLICGATYFLNAGKRWEERRGDEGEAVEINPFHPDGFGGLGALSDAVIGYLYGISLFALLLGLSFLKEGSEPAWHNYAMMFLFLPLGMWGVLAPAIAVRRTIVDAKNGYLNQLAGELHTIGNSILQALPTGRLTKELREGDLDKQQKGVRALYDEVQRMSEWPFNTGTLLRMIFPIAAPWLPALLKQWAELFIN